MDSRNNFPVRRYGDGSGFLDHLFNGDMGVELLIRPSKDNKFDATGLLEPGRATWRSLRGHAARADQRAAEAAGQSCYENTAKRCTKGYMTVLLATLMTTTVQYEWSNFQAFIKAMKDDKTMAGALKHHIMVAVARFGWGSFVAFLHEPGKEPVKFSIPRQRLLFKLVDGQLQSARHFYPRPETVWVQQLLKKGSYLQPSWSAFKVAPEEDSVESLADAVARKRGILSQHPLKIYMLNHAGGWWEWIQAASQVLYANAEEKPYGYYISE